jgi:hypothetical protein
MYAQPDRSNINGLVRIAQALHTLQNPPAGAHKSCQNHKITQIICANLVPHYDLDNISSLICAWAAVVTSARDILIHI